MGLAICIIGILVTTGSIVWVNKSAHHKINELEDL